MLIKGRMLLEYRVTMTQASSLNVWSILLFCPFSERNTDSSIEYKEDDSISVVTSPGKRDNGEREGRVTLADRVGETPDT